MDSSDEKHDDIMDKYDQNDTLLNISDENIEKIRPKLLDEVEKQIIAKL